ncbi:uncharacterized protein LACBIDRAFT_317985 [Laccaria bicolor S238N-H82]|uniref:Predicted protein n=1 Tax=Laccaria bicolor (strain S238N-H82 / ATCC MYA-4686) TaxID=486041 RepID=B0D5P0_LACBS|nr:uncharacterized protein LACBIDRAFT_317985 [Laccaria bicolor S238N-H82]EDR09807.1 predicted protein [Laccaria bicolor S238N-H82]|eukprot:XP_001879192.1 predicted protein [Laccaria bicolor S238N-H82]
MRNEVSYYRGSTSHHIEVCLGETRIMSCRSDSGIGAIKRTRLLRRDGRHLLGTVGSVPLAGPPDVMLEADSGSGLARKQTVQEDQPTTECHGEIVQRPIEIGLVDNLKVRGGN